MATKTFAQLTEATSIDDADLLALYPTGGPLKRFLASVLKTYLGGSFLKVDGSNAMTGQLPGAVGSVGSPGYSFDGDADTGFYRIGANNLGISVGGVKQADVSATQFALSTAVAFQGVLSPSQITSNQNDYNPTGLSTASILRLSTDASRNITGIQGGATGRQLTLVNVGSFNIVLKNADTNSTAANRFDMGADVTIGASQAVTISYDATTARWRCVGSPISLPLGAASGGTGIANNAANTITFSGNFGLTLTLSGTTGVTLPTSGTVAVLGTAQTWGAAQTFPTATGINGNAGTARNFNWMTATSVRWRAAANSSPETGSNAGSNWVLAAIADDGTTVVGTAITVTRSDLGVQFGSYARSTTYLQADTYVRVGTTTVAGLSSYTVQGATIMVSDATATTRYTAPVGGGANKVIVFYDGAGWLIL